MISHLFPQDTEPQMSVCQEGDLYKIVNIHGRTFKLYYGYYEDCDRENPAVDPMPIYPDFLKEPQYTDEGFSFVTKMQDACRHYKGKAGKFNDCAECQYYMHGDELLGICTCPKNKKASVQPGDGYE